MLVKNEHWVVFNIGEEEVARLKTMKDYTYEYDIKEEVTEVKEEVKEEVKKPTKKTTKSKK